MKHWDPRKQHPSECSCVHSQCPLVAALPTSYAASWFTGVDTRSSRVRMHWSIGWRQLETCFSPTFLSQKYMFFKVIILNPECIWFFDSWFGERKVWSGYFHPFKSLRCTWLTSHKSHGWFCLFLVVLLVFKGCLFLNAVLSPEAVLEHPRRDTVIWISVLVTCLRMRRKSSTVLTKTMSALVLAKGSLTCWEINR